MSLLLPPANADVDCPIIYTVVLSQPWYALECRMRRADVDTLLTFEGVHTYVYRERYIHILMRIQLDT